MCMIKLCKYAAVLSRACDAHIGSVSLPKRMVIFISNFKITCWFYYLSTVCAVKEHYTLLLRHLMTFRSVKQNKVWRQCPLQM